MNRFDFFNGVPTQPTMGGIGGNPMSYFNESSTNMSMQYGGNQFGATNFVNVGGFGYQGQGFMNPPQPNLQTPNFQGYNTGGNPALQMIQQNPALMGGGLGYMPYNPGMQQPQYQDKVVHVPGLQMRPDPVMWSTDLEQRLEQLQMDMMLDLEKAELERQQRFQGYYNNNMGAYNYYGMPYFQNANSNSFIENKYKQKVAEIIEEGKQRQINFNKKMSRIAHSFLGIPVEEEELDRTFGGYDYTIPAVQQQEDSMQQELARFKPYSNQNVYASQFNATWEASQRLMKDVHTLDDFLEIQGVLTTIDMLEEDYHARRNGTQYYQPDSYKNFLRKSILKKNGMLNQNQQQAVKENIPFGRFFPELNESAKLMEDGTISISIPENFGELAAQRRMNGNRQMVVEQEFENHFEENRRAFLASIYGQGAPNGS